MSYELKVNEKQGSKVDCACGTCKRSTKHEILVEATTSGSTGPDEWAINWANEYQVVRCLGCESVAFRKTEGNDHDSFVQVSDNDWEYQPNEHIYPSPHDGRQQLNDADLLPHTVDRIYAETLGALNNQQEVLCGIGIRAIIEAVCKEKSAAGKDLYNKINGLVTAGVLTNDGAAILHKLRVMGNDAAHEVKPHTKKELGLALDVVDHLLLGVYILPEHAKKTFK